MLIVLIAAALAAGPTASRQVATADVAAAVEQAFPDHDVNGDGTLSRTEFGRWLIGLKALSDPAASADTPATQSWIAGAWSRADADASRSVSPGELTALFGGVGAPRG